MSTPSVEQWACYCTVCTAGACSGVVDLDICFRGAIITFGVEVLISGMAEVAGLITSPVLSVDDAISARSISVCDTGKSPAVVSGEYVWFKYPGNKKTIVPKPMIDSTVYGSLMLILYIG